MGICYRDLQGHKWHEKDGCQLFAVLPGTRMKEHKIKMEPGSKETKDSDS